MSDRSVEFLLRIHKGVAKRLSEITPRTPEEHAYAVGLETTKSQIEAKLDELIKAREEQEARNADRIATFGR